MPKAANQPADNILPLYMNGLSGRMLRLPPSGKYRREILLVYGHHASIERMFGLAEYLSRYGSVTLPDLPGFGGMEPYYKIGVKPTIDALADYLASFIKLRYKQRRFSVVGLSLGFAIVTRMLQKYPEIAQKTDLVISVVGFAHHDDFVFGRSRYFIYRSGASLLSNRLPGALLKHLIFRPLFIRQTYQFMANRNPKLKVVSDAERKQWIEFEVELWRINDARTYMETGTSMLKLKLPPVHVDLPVHHIAIKNDRYFDNNRVEQHMRRIYRDFKLYNAKVPLHAPSVLATAADAARYVPPKLRGILRRPVKG